MYCSIRPICRLFVTRESKDAGMTTEDKKIVTPQMKNLNHSSFVFLLHTPTLPFATLTTSIIDQCAIQRKRQDSKVMQSVSCVPSCTYAADLLPSILASLVVNLESGIFK